MKNDDLERLEESKEVQQMIRLAKEQYEQEKAEHAPADFSAMMQSIHHHRKEKKMKRGISPWWLAAACLMGCIIGYAFSASGEISLNETERLAVTDTVVVIRERVDTVYKEVKPQVLIAQKSSSEAEYDSQATGVKKSSATANSTITAKSSATAKSITPKPSATHKQTGTRKQTAAPVNISPEFLQQQMSMPDPDSECYAANGMTVADDNYPLHLLVTIP